MRRLTPETLAVSIVLVVAAAAGVTALLGFAVAGGLLAVLRHHKTAGRSGEPNTTNG